jgi:hypothetical protein
VRGTDTKKRWSRDEQSKPGEVRHGSLQRDPPPREFPVVQASIHLLRSYNNTHGYIPWTLVMNLSMMKRWQHYNSARVVAMTACAIVVLTCSGCLALAVGAAGGVAGAAYVLGKLTDELNYEVPVVHAAATPAINDLDLKLSEDRADKLTNHMKSEFADGTNVWIDMQSIAEGRTKLTVRVGVTGDEVRARNIHDAIKRHLPREL